MMLIMGAFLKHYITNENPQQVLASNTLNNQRNEYINKLKNINTLKKIKEESNNVKYPKSHALMKIMIMEFVMLFIKKQL